MGKRLKAEFEYHNVGQGLFYSGEIVGSNGYIFKFVYDCGSTNKETIYASISKFKDKSKNDKINMLIISHLHSDHINGLDELLKHFKVYNVVLPYFAPEERLLIALKKINASMWYYDFLKDPVYYLMEKGVEKVIILGGEKGSEHENNIPTPNENRDVIFEFPNDDYLIREILDKENWEPYIKDGRVSVKNHDGYMLALGLWVFRFFNYKIKQPNVFNLFYRCFKGNLNIRDSENLKKFITNKEKLKKLQKCYKYLLDTLGKDFNNTSLVLYNGPVGKAKSNYRCETLFPQCFRCIHECCLYNYYNCWSSAFGQFLTGDINLNLRYEEILKHYDNYLEKVIITQIPHHGSAKNWNRNLLRDLFNCKTWIISAGLKYKKHPSYEVIEDINLSGRVCLWVNEMNYFKIESIVEWQ